MKQVMFLIREIKIDQKKSNNRKATIDVNKAIKFCDALKYKAKFMKKFPKVKYDDKKLAKLCKIAGRGYNNYMWKVKI